MRSTIIRATRESSAHGALIWQVEWVSWTAARETFVFTEDKDYSSMSEAEKKSCIEEPSLQDVLDQ